MKSYFPDINVWIALAYEGHQHNIVAATWFNQVQNGNIYFCRLTQLGFLRLLTHSVVMGADVKTQAEAWKSYDLLTEDPRVDFYVEPDMDILEQEFRLLTNSSRAMPQQWPDAYLAAFARSGGLTLVTFDRSLSKLIGSDVLLLK